eukprot:EG_transcript_2850
MSICPCVKGKKLADIKPVNAALNKVHAEDRVAVHLHKLLFNSMGKVKSRKQNLKAFFGICSCDPEPVKRRLEKVPAKLLRDIAQIFDCPLSAKASAAELQHTVMRFIFNPQPRSVLEVSLGEQSVPHQDLVIAEKPCAAEVEDELEGTADPAEGEEFTEDLLYDSAGSMSEDILDLNAAEPDADVGDLVCGSPKRQKAGSFTELVFPPNHLAANADFLEADSHCDDALSRLSRAQREVRRLLESEPLLTDEMLQSRMPISLRRQKREPKPVLRRHQRPKPKPQPSHCIQPVSPTSSGVRPLKVRAMVIHGSTHEMETGRALPIASGDPLLPKAGSLAESPEVISVCSSVGPAWSSSPSMVPPHSFEGVGGGNAPGAFGCSEETQVEFPPPSLSGVTMAEAMPWELEHDDMDLPMPAAFTPPLSVSGTSPASPGLGLAPSAASPEGRPQATYWEESEDGEAGSPAEAPPAGDGDDWDEAADGAAPFGSQASSSRDSTAPLRYTEGFDEDALAAATDQRLPGRGRPKRQALVFQATAPCPSPESRAGAPSWRTQPEVPAKRRPAQQPSCWAPLPAGDDFPAGEPRCWPLDVPDLERPGESCELGTLCEEFLPRLQVGEFLRRRHDQCFCLKCYPKDLPDVVPCAGHKFVVPRGWKRFGVEVLQGKAQANNIWHSWHVAFHGLAIDGLRRSFLHGQILLPGDKLLEGGHLGVRKGHIPARRFFFSSPTVKYAELDMYATPVEWVSREGFVYEAKAVLQVRQKPGAYQRQRESVGAVTDLCKHTCNEEIEWLTDNRASVVVTGILLRLGRKK